MRPAGGVVGTGGAAEERPQAVGVLGDLADEGGRHEPRARLHRHAHAQPRVGGVGSRGDGAGLSGLGVAADRTEEHPLAVDGDFELVLVLEPANRLEIGARQRDVELVLGVERKRVAHPEATHGAERQALRGAGSATDRPRV